MLRADDPRLEDMQHYLSLLDGPIMLESAIKSMYEEDHRQTCIYAEI